jgi:hypothetical protein
MNVARLFFCAAERTWEWAWQMKEFGDPDDDQTPRAGTRMRMMSNNRTRSALRVQSEVLLRSHERQRQISGNARRARRSRARRFHDNSDDGRHHSNLRLVQRRRLRPL